MLRLHVLLLALIVSLGENIARAQGPARQYHSIRRPSRRVEATLNVRVRFPGMRKIDSCNIMYPKAYNTAGQTMLEPESVLVGGVESTAVRAFEEASPHKRWMARCYLPVMGNTVVFAVRYRVQLWQRRLVPGPPPEGEAVEPITRAQRMQFTASTAMIDHASESAKQFRAKHGLNRLPGEDEVTFVKRMFLATTGSFRYRYVPGQDRVASHLWAMPDRWTDCGGSSVAFVSLVRAGGVPARLPAGWTLSSIHVRSEVYLTGVGWHPLDVSFSLQKPAAERERNFFRGDDGEFLMLHMDPEFVLPTERPSGVTKQDWVQAPTATILGSGSLADSARTQQISVVDLPAGAGAYDPKNRFARVLKKAPPRRSRRQSR